MHHQSALEINNIPQKKTFLKSKFSNHISTKHMTYLKIYKLRYQMKQTLLGPKTQQKHDSKKNNNNKIKNKNLNVLSLISKTEKRCLKIYNKPKLK